MVFIALLGALAGALTTVTGVGGGLLLLLALAVRFDPATALAITAPGLLAGNLHRLFMFRRHVDLPLATRLAAGAVPGALAGGLLAARLPEAALRGILLLATALAVTKSLGWLRWTPPRAAVVPVGALAGALTASGGGGGILIPPTLLTLGVTGSAYLATASMAAASIHVGRLAAYGLAGWMNETRWMQAALLAVAIPAGNLLGRAIRERIGESVSLRCTQVTLVTVTLLAVLGVT